MLRNRVAGCIGRRGADKPMEVDFTLQESSALYRLLTENSSDIVIKTDRDGVICHASASARQLAAPFNHPLLGSRLEDLVGKTHAAALRATHEAALVGQQDNRALECPLVTAIGDEQWFEIRMRSLIDDSGDVYGAVAILRSIEERRRLEDKAFAAAMTDPLTGLTNRRAFIAMLQHLVDKQISGCLAIFDIDHFRALNLQHGLAFGDDVLVAFANTLRGLMRHDDIVSRIGGESLGVLLPRTEPHHANAICRRVVKSLGGTRLPMRGKNVPISASGGIARIDRSVDDTIARAELALFLAKAKGRNRVETDERHRTNWSRTGAYELVAGYAESIPSDTWPQLDTPPS